MNVTDFGYFGAIYSYYLRIMRTVKYLLFTLAFHHIGKFIQVSSYTYGNL